MSFRSIQAPVSPSELILLVDDNYSGLAARRVVLEELGYKTVGVRCPHEALSLIKDRPIDLVVTDYKMPEMTGVDFIKLMRAEKPNMPVVLLSGYVDSLGLNEKNTGANAVLMKSANEVQHLVRAVKRLLHNRRAKRKPPSASGSTPAKRSRAAS